MSNWSQTIPEVLILVITFQIQNAKVALGLVGSMITHYLPEFLQKFPLISTVENQNIWQMYGVREKLFILQVYKIWFF